MKAATLLPLLGNLPEKQTNITAGNVDSKEPAFSFLQIIEALLNLQLNLSGKTDNEGEGDFVDPTVIVEKKQREGKEQLNPSGEGTSLSLQSTGDPLLSIGTDAQPKQYNFVVTDILKLLTVKDTHNSQCSEKALFTTPLLGEVDLQNALQGMMTNAVQEGIAASSMQQIMQHQQGFSQLADNVAATVPDPAVKAEAVVPGSAQLESLLADSPLTAADTTAEAEQGKLFDRLSGVEIEEQPASIRTQDNPSVQIKTNQHGSLPTGLGSSSTEALFDYQKNDLLIAKNMRPAETAELIAKQLVDQAELFVGKERADLRLQLNPDFLGQLKLVIRVENRVVRAHFIAENQITASLIEGQMQDLRQCLEQQGISWQELSVAVGGQDSFHGYNDFAAYKSPQGKGHKGEDSSSDVQREQPWWQEGIVDYLV